MTAHAFVRELEAFKDGLIGQLAESGRTWLAAGALAGDEVKLLQVALTNEISVCDLAAMWVPGTRELDAKLAFARQAGDEAGHFKLVADRLARQGLEEIEFTMPEANPLFEYLRSLSSTVERLAAGLFTLESMAYAVNENFMALCARRGDQETVDLYRNFIQPDERSHQEMGRELLARYATTPALQAQAKQAVRRTLAIASAVRARGAAKLGTACLPGC